MPHTDSRIDRARLDKKLWILQHGPCVRCGSWDFLTLDHIDKNSKDPRIKGKGTSAIWLWGEYARNLELRKCQILCITCHRQKDRLETLGDETELVRQQQELRRRSLHLEAEMRARRAAEVREAILHPAPVEPAIEERIERLRAKYAKEFHAEVVDEIVEDDQTAEVTHGTPPVSWLAGLINWPNRQ